MGRILRALSVIVLLIVLSLAALVPSQAQLLQPDLVPQKLSLSPPSPVNEGTIVHISATVSNGGTAQAGEFTVEISWRRVDKEELCGFARTGLPGLEAGGQATIQTTIDTTDLTPGEYEVTMRVDPDDRVTELDETNNRLSKQLKILPPKPELHPISLSFDPPSPVERGETVRVTTELENTGESTAGGFRVEFLYRRGAGSWTSFGSTLIPGLERDGHLTLEQTLDTSALELDPQADLTSFSIKVTVDPPSAAEPEGAVAEQDEDNNEIIASLGVLPSKLDLPELHPVSIIFNRDLPLEWGRDITATVSVINTGGRKAQDIGIAFYYRKLGAGEWKKFATDTIASLGVEEQDNSDTASGQLDVPGLGLAPGSYELKVVVDPANTIDERNEANNELVVAFSIQGSELQPQSIELGAMPVHQGDTITIASQIENTGEKPAKSFTVGFFIDNRRFDTFYYEDEKGLEKNETVKAQGTLDTTDLPPGDYTLRVFVDPDNQIPELDEANNVISAPLKILPPEPRLAELHPTGLSLEPPSPVRGGRMVQVTATVWNTGNIDAERFQVELAYSSDGQSWTPFAVQDIPSLSRGGKETVEGQLDTAGLTIGTTYQIRVLVDPKDEIQELDEGNNVLIATLSLVAPAVSPPGANLTLQDLTLNPPSPVAQGTQVQVCAMITNTGRGAAGEFLVDFLHRQDQAGSFSSFASRSVPGLEVGQSITICELFNTTTLLGGSYELKAVADSGNWIQELDETDNELTRTLIISLAVPRPDLHPAGVTFDPPSPVGQGTPVQVCAKVTNLGATAAGPFTVSYAYLLDSYVQFATAQVPGLGGGKQVRLCRALDTSNLAPGTYKIRIVVDPDNRVMEGNEANNELGGYLSIVAPFPPTPQLALGTGGAVRLLALDEGTGAVYIASEDGKLYALKRGGEAKSGFPFAAGSPIRALALDVGAPRAVYLGTAEGKLYAVGLDSGREICQAALNSAISALGVDKFGNIYVGTETKLVSLTAGCEPRWEFTTVGIVKALVVDDAHDAIYAIASGGLLYALGRDGTLRWQLDLRSPLSALALGRAIYVGTEDGKVQAVGLSGSLGWSFTAGGAIMAIVVDRERDSIYAASADGKLYSLSLEGNLRWVFSSGGPIRSTPAIDGRTGAIFLGSDEGKLYALNPDGTEIFAATVGSPIRSQPVIDVVVQRDGAKVRLVRTVYFGAEDQNVYKIKVELRGGN